MKKTTLLCTAMLAAFAMPLMSSAQTTGSEVIFDQTPWDNEQVLKLFSTAWDEGRNYPTEAELQAIGMHLIDLEIVRSHTRYRDIAKDASRDIVSDLNHNRRLWCNFPAGYGKNTGGYPSTMFDQDVFSMWNYANIFGSWNYGFLLAPGCWVDAAHKNGTRIYSGIKFFESWNNDGSEAAFNNFIQTKNSDGTYKYARAFVNAATYFGNDGYNYNQEGTTYQSSEWYNFHAAVMEQARSLNLTGFGIGQYTQNASVSASSAPYLLGTSAGKTFDCMLNYSGNKLYYRGASSSYQAAAALGLGEDVYQGCLIVGMSSDYWTQMNTDATKLMNICLWGEHDQSRFFQFRVGDDPISIQENYQMILEKGFSGANRNPLNRPAINNAWGSFQIADASLSDQQLNNAPGFASMIPERTAINFDLPFETHFSLGNGENYFYKGKVTHGSWYNMSQQDIVPTYRWLVCKKGDMTTYASDIDARFTHEDAYMAGSSLKLSGATTSGNDIVLYRTNLNVANGTPKVTVALKGAAGASHVSVILKKRGATSWVEVPYGDLASTSWQEKTLAVSGIGEGDVIEYIGLRVNGTTSSDWKAYVGKLKISDNRNVQQALIDESSVVCEVKEETTTSLSVKLGWKPDYSGYTTSINDFGMVYNDEINVDHFEIFYKEGSEGKAKEVGRTAQWATYIGNIPCTQNTDAYIGVRSVSVDLTCMSPVVWVRIPHSEGTLPEAKVEDPYGVSNQTSIGNGTAENCLKNIWVEKVTTTGATQNLNYTATSNPCVMDDNQYYFASDHKLVLTQGQTVTLTYKGYNSGTSESLKYDFVNAYIDYDGNYSFMDADEVLGKFGSLNAGTDAIVNPGLTINFTVPEDAHIGESRLRIVGSDAWTPHPGATGGTVKGYSIDFPVEITGTNPDRGPAETYKDRRDQGEPEEPEFIEEGVMGINEAIADGDIASVSVENRVAYFTNTEKAWFYDINGRCVKAVLDGSESVSLNELTAGVYIVKLLNNQVIRAHKVVVK